MSDSSNVEDRPKSKRVGALRGLVPFLWPYRGMAALALLALMLTAGISLVLPLAVRRVVDGLNSARVELLDKYFGTSLDDFLSRVDPRVQEAENLAKVGALDGFGKIDTPMCSKLFLATDNAGECLVTGSLIVA